VFVTRDGYAKKVAKNIALNVDLYRQVVRNDVEDKSLSQYENSIRKNTSDLLIDFA
jgi:hypothetical protein